MTASVPSHEELQELLGAYALDAIDAEERALIDDHLGTCPRCRAEVADHRETAALLAFSGQDAPDGVWDQISRRLVEPPPALDLGARRGVSTLDHARADRRSRRGLGRLPLTIVAAAAVVISVLSLGVALRGDGASTGGLPAEVASAPRIHLTSVSGQHSADVVVVDGRGYVFNDNLPALPDGEVYQLWGKRGEQLISLGLLGDDPEQERFVAAGEFEAFAITAEDWPGVVQSRNEPVVIGRVLA